MGSEEGPCGAFSQVLWGLRLAGNREAGQFQERGRRGQVRVELPGLEGEGCLAAAAITQSGWTGSFLLPDLLPALEG